MSLSHMDSSEPYVATLAHIWLPTPASTSSPSRRSARIAGISGPCSTSRVRRNVSARTSSSCSSPAVRAAAVGAVGGPDLVGEAWWCRYEPALIGGDLIWCGMRGLRGFLVALSSPFPPFLRPPAAIYFTLSRRGPENGRGARGCPLLRPEGVLQLRLRIRLLRFFRIGGDRRQERW